MKAQLLTRFALLLTLSGSVLPVAAQSKSEKHPTLTAAHRYGHRKTAAVGHVARQTKHNVKQYGHRKAHNTRHWLNSH